MDKEIIPKILAIYLPQFHITEDNNKWWGEGFTDWESVKSAEPCFDGHNAPWAPMGNQYYDLSNPETLKHQAELAKEYGVGGFCFYHYYFKNGKKELELPAELLLQNKQIDMPFCFNWASESWVRSWSRIEGNVWAEKYEPANKDSGKSVLVEQDYGSYSDWEKHFYYLLPFFNDERYIKKDGKPVFIFYSPEDIGPLKEMTACWRDLARKNGFDNLYLIGAHMSAASDILDAALIYEPRNSVNMLNNKNQTVMRNGVRCFDYEQIWKAVIDTAPIYGYKTYFCGISGYDDTPRRGKSGECFINDNPGIFKKYLIKLLQKSMNYGNEFLFINAWNEWGEGMYLEPDERNKFSYLEAVKNATQEIHNLDVLTKDVQEGDISVREEIARLNREAKKFKWMSQLLDKWLFLEQDEQIDFKSYFEEENIRNVAIYGMSSIGKHLLIQLQKEGINVAFGIDRYVGQFGNDFIIYRPEETFPAVDAVIVTAYDVFGIKEFLQNTYHGRILELNNILDRMMKMEKQK